MAKKGRRNFLEEFLGKDKKEEIEAGAVAFQSVLDNAKINRKEYAIKTQKAFAEDLIASFIEDLAAVTDDTELQTSLANKFLALAMGAFAAEQPADVIEEEPLPEEAVEIMADDEEAVIVDDEEEEEETVAELSKQVTEMAKENAAMYKMMNEFIPAMIDMAKTVKELTPLVKQADEVTALKAKIAEFQKTMDARPRIASQDNGNVLLSDKAAQKIESDIKKGTEGQKTELGLKVKY